MDDSLGRNTLTVASRVMLPAYVLFYGWVGVGYLTTPALTLAANPALAYADGLVSLRLWGIVFTAASLLMLAALVSRRRVVARFALWLCIVSMSLWALLIMASVVFGDGSPTSPAWPVLATLACYASERSLRAGEAT